MIRRPLAFTLIEVLICLVTVTIVSVPVLDFFINTSRNYHKAIRWNDLKHETDRIGYRVVGLLRSTHKFTISRDNRAVNWPPHNSLRWREGTLVLKLGSKGHPLSSNVTHFSLLRRNGETQLTLECVDEATGRKNRRRYFVEASDE